MSEKARLLLRKLRSERQKSKNHESFSVGKEVTNKFLLKLKSTDEKDGKEEKKEIDPLNFFDLEKKKIEPMNMDEFKQQTDNDSESEEKNEKKDCEKKIGKEMLIEGFKLNITDIINAKRRLGGKSEEEIKEIVKKEEEEKKEEQRKKLEEIKKIKDRNNIDDMSFAMKRELIREIRKSIPMKIMEVDENENNDNKKKIDIQKKKENKIKKLEMRLKKARQKFVEIYMKKQNLNLVDDIIKKAKELEAKMNIPKELVIKIHQILDLIKLPNRVIIDDEVSILENEYNVETPIKKISKEEIKEIMSKGKQ